MLRDIQFAKPEKQIYLMISQYGKIIEVMGK